MHLDASHWHPRAAAHGARLSPVVTPYLEARSRGQKDPVLDFLFEYYALRPGHLMRWSPGAGVVLTGEGARDQFRPSMRVPCGVGWMLDRTRFKARRLKALDWTVDLLRAVQNRTPFFGCGGMHEWAMVYKAGTVRHNQVPLRLPERDLQAFVESRPIVCSHFDAFRFFTPEARPLNRHQPTHDGMQALEQPGCIHANMDVYRWAMKFYPWIEGEVLADAFFVALEARKVDMRASPYDLADEGLVPIPVETPEGQRQYQAAQQQIYAATRPVRSRLIEALIKLREMLSDSEGAVGERTEGIRT